jgi:hypothetical protein
VKYVYKINNQHPTWPEFSIEADSYGQKDTFFEFYEGFGSNREKVASVAAEQVFNIERTMKDAR